MRAMYTSCEMMQSGVMGAIHVAECQSINIGDGYTQYNLSTRPSIAEQNALQTVSLWWPPQVRESNENVRIGAAVGTMVVRALFIWRTLADVLHTSVNTFSHRD